MMEYNNPNSPWMHTGYDPYYENMSDDDRVKSGCMQVIIYIVAIIVGLALCALFGSCATTKYVPVTQQHTEHHWHTDSVRERDSVHTENSTIIRELDSAAMARYGIQLKNAERAWLVQSREMEMRLRELERMTATRDTVHDSIPAPYPVEVEVPADLTWWQQTRLHIANVLLWLLAFVAAWYIAGFVRKFVK
jgi:hypothetical protein